LRQEQQRDIHRSQDSLWDIHSLVSAVAAEAGQSRTIFFWEGVVEVVEASPVHAQSRQVLYALVLYVLDPHVRVLLVHPCA
jgi:hypothetical protein